MDWPQLIRELSEAKLTQEQIAEACGVAQSTLSDLARGATKAPGFDFGSRLVALHKATCSTRPQPAEAQP